MALDQLVTRLWNYSQAPPQVNGSLIRLKLDAGKVDESGGTLDIGPGVVGYSLLLEEMNHSQMDLVFGSPAPRRLIGQVRSGVDALRFTLPEGENIMEAQLHLDERQEALELRPRATYSLAVQGGLFTVIGRAPVALDLKDTTVQLPNSVMTLTLRGNVRAGTGSVQATHAFIDGTATIGGGEWWLGELLSLGEDPPRLQVASGSVLVGWVSDGADLWCEREASLELGRGPVPEQRPSQSLVIFAKGRVHVHGVLQKPTFASPVPADLHVIGTVLDAVGRVRLEAENRAIVNGAPDGALVLEELKTVTGAELEDVNIYHLNIGDLQTLKDAERVEPWLPRPRMARLAEDAMFREQEPRVAQRQRMHFWSQMTDVLRMRKAPGRLQSEVRYAAQRARRKALAIGRERAVLTAYGLVGYGERILLPLLWYVVLASVLTAWFSVPEQGDKWSLGQSVSLFIDVVESPLAFFRLAAVPSLESTPQELALLGYRVVGLLLLLLSVFAVRRLVRLE
jgi:hypothetical protein